MVDSIKNRFVSFGRWWEGNEKKCGIQALPTRNEFFWGLLVSKSPFKSLKEQHFPFVEYKVPKWLLAVESWNLKWH